MIKLLLIGSGGFIGSVLRYLVSGSVQTLCPRIVLEKAITPRQFMKLITNRTTLSPGVVLNVQESEVETLIDLLKAGRPVHTGIAIFAASVDLQGNFSVNVRVDKRILCALNAPRGFTGRIKTKDNIGKTPREIVSSWDADHPGDPVESS